MFIIYCSKNLITSLVILLVFHYVTTCCSLHDGHAWNRLFVLFFRHYSLERSKNDSARMKLQKKRIKIPQSLVSPIDRFFLAGISKMYAEFRFSLFVSPTLVRNFLRSTLMEHALDLHKYVLIVFTTHGSYSRKIFLDLNHFVREFTR